jgi:tetratricopeptide (TPR) repeat protein
MSQVVQDPVEAGREAIRRFAWAEGFELLRSADEARQLGPDDLLLIGEAAMWNGRMEESDAYLERAYRGYLDEGQKLRAAFVATWLAHNTRNNLQSSVANGWMSRARRLLDEEEESAEHGYWALQKSLDALNVGEFDEAVRLAKQAEDLGRRFGDRNLEIRGIQRQGNALIAKGELTEGKVLLDEASGAALAGELNPLSTLTVYCNTIGACRDVADFESASEWTDRASAFCDANAATAFPGMCRVNHAEVMRYKGRLSEAEELAGKAGEELRFWNPRIAGAAFYELGEVRLRLGELAQAEQAFREADEFGRTPEPGLSLLRLVQGNAKGAFASIRRSLADDSLSVPARARLLPAAVEIATAQMTSRPSGTPMSRPRSEPPPSSPRARSSSLGARSTPPSTPSATPVPPGSRPERPTMSHARASSSAGPSARSETRRARSGSSRPPPRASSASAPSATPTAWPSC